MIITTCKEAAEMLSKGQAVKALFRPADLPLASGQMQSDHEMTAGMLGLQTTERIPLEYSDSDPAYVWGEDDEQ